MSPRRKKAKRLRARVEHLEFALGLARARLADLEPLVDRDVKADCEAMADAIRRTACDLGLEHPGTVDDLVGACALISLKHSAAVKGGAA